MDNFKDNNVRFNRRIGKIIFIVILSLGLSLYFYNDNIKDNNTGSDLTFDEYSEVYDEYKEGHEAQPEYLWIYPIFFFISFAVLFLFYEFTGLLFDWIMSGLSKKSTLNSHIEEQMHMNSYIPMDLRNRVDRELEPNEQIQWIDMPVPKFFTKFSTPLFLFAIPWTSFAVFWIIGASQSPSKAFALFGVPFLLIGVCMLLSPLWAYYKTLKSVYVITSKRAIIIDGGKSFTIRSYPPEKLHNIYRVEKKNGIGDVLISFSTWTDSDGDTQKTDIGFINIRDPKYVESMLKNLAEQNN